MADHGGQARWGDQEELLAATLEQLQVIASLLHRAWFKPPHPEPSPVPRPGDAPQAAPDGRAEPEERPRMSTRAEIRAFFGARGGGTTIQVDQGTPAASPGPHRPAGAAEPQASGAWPEVG